MPSISVLIKPASSACNMNCKYCFYKDEAQKRQNEFQGKLSVETAENIIKSAVDFSDGHCFFMFQGGEPTLAGLDFFRAFIELEKKHAKKGIEFHNSIQTNGYIIDAEWAKFLHDNNFLVGLSIDGPAEFHDANRVDNNNKGSFNKIIKAAKLFDKYEVQYNVLSVVTGKNARSVQKIYNFYKKQGFKYLQFIPCLEPLGDARGNADFSLSPKEYADFLVTIFNLWLKDFKNNNYISIRHIDNQLSMMLGANPEICSMNGCCSIQFVVEGDGSVYPCDFYVLDEWKIGEIGKNSFEEMINSKKAVNFIESSRNILEECKSCPFFCICRNGCRRDRITDNNGIVGKNYYCDSYKYYYAKCNAGFTEAIKLIKK